jgi:hypothetical protein
VAGDLPREKIPDMAGLLKTRIGFRRTKAALAKAF